jgi:hypothetical protein
MQDIKDSDESNLSWYPISDVEKQKELGVKIHLVGSNNFYAEILDLESDLFIDKSLTYFAVSKTADKTKTKIIESDCCNKENVKNAFLEILRFVENMTNDELVQFVGRETLEESVVEILKENGIEYARYKN